MRYKDVGYESRQVVDIEISRNVTEYRAQVLEDANGKRYIAPFPEGVNRPIQYGLDVKVHSVYMSQYQLVPYKRIEEDFQDQIGIPISAGTIFNFNYDAYHKLEAFEAMVKSKLIESGLCHADETGININGKRVWLHCISNDLWRVAITPMKKEAWKPWKKWGYCHISKGSSAMITGNHISNSTAAMLCVMPITSESWKEPGNRTKQEWARDMRGLLSQINQAVDDAGGRLEPAESQKYRQK